MPESSSDDFFHTYTTVPGDWYFTTAQLTAMGTNGPVTETINLNLINNGKSGISIPAVYNMKFHNEYENWHTYEVFPDYLVSVSNFTVATPGYALGKGTIQCTWNDMLLATSAALQVSAVLITNPIYAAGFEALGVTLGMVGPTPNNGTAPWAWNWTGSTINGSWSDDQENYIMFPSLFDKYTPTVQQCDQYGPNGYIGYAYDTKALLVGTRWTGNFQPRSSTGGSGGGGGS